MFIHLAGNVKFFAAKLLFWWLFVITERYSITRCFIRLIRQTIMTTVTIRRWNKNRISDRMQCQSISSQRTSYTRFHHLTFYGTWEYAIVQFQRSINSINSITLYCKLIFDYLIVRWCLFEWLKSICKIKCTLTFCGYPGYYNDMVLESLRLHHFFRLKYICNHKSI